MGKHINVSVQGKSYQLDASDHDGLREIPWPIRKELIGVLEVMKKLDHIEKKDDTQNEVERLVPIDPVPSPQPQSVVKNAPSESDPDLLMQQFLAQQPNKNAIPEKASVYKGLLIFLVLVVVLAWLF